MSAANEIDRNRQALATDPEDTLAFEALEEQLFLQGDWETLVEVYEERLRAPSLEADPQAAVGLIFRLGQVLEERCLEPDRAIEHYWRVAKVDPTHRSALRQLRQIHAARQQWDLVLQIAEHEAQAPMKEYECAAFLCEMGQIWLTRLEDAGEALGCFQRALECDPDHQDALEGLARTYERFGRAADAARVWEQLAERLRGPDRAPALLALGRLLAGPLDQDERAAECYRRALTDDPRNEDAVEALVVLTSSREQWPLLADLFERRFDLAAGARRRTAIALEAGHLHLEHLNDPQTARLWFTRAQELCPDDVAVYNGLAELERRTGNTDALRQALARVIELAANSVPVSVLMEAANLESEQGNEELALVNLTRAQERSPEDPLILEALSDSLKRLQRWSELAEILELRANLAADDEATRAEMWSDLGRVYADALADPQASREAYERAFQACPDAPELASRLERLYRKSEDWPALREMLERAHRAGPEAERAAFACSLGELLAETLAEPEGARAAFEAALAIEPEAHRALQGLARLASAAGDDDSLLEAYEREAHVTTDATRLGFLVWELVGLLEARERPEDALGWIERLIEITPDDRSTLECAARLQATLGHHESLRRTLEVLHPLLAAGEKAPNLRRLAWLELEAERVPEAVAAFESALEVDPGDVASLRALERHYEGERRLEDLARVKRKLGDLLSGAEAVRCLEELAQLLEESLGDLDAAIVVVWRLHGLDGPERPADIDARLEGLLERAGRFEELAQQLLGRRRSLAAEAPEAVALDLRRARLLLDPLGHFDEAAAMFRAVRERQPDCEEASAGLERALRAGNDSRGLADWLGERAGDESDLERRAALEFERAVLLEEALGEVDAAREAYAAIANRADRSLASDAERRLERLLERSGEWQALRSQLESALERATPEEAPLLHERLASLCRDRLSDREGCIEHLEAAGRCQPENPRTWRSLALLYRDLDRPDDLIRVMEAELATSPDRGRSIALHARLAQTSLAARRGDDLARDHYEALLEIEPRHSEAAEFLIDHYERAGRTADVVRLLELRLDGAEDAGEADESLATSLRLRIADLCAEALDDPARAIAVLERKLDRKRPQAVLAEPLAELYPRVDRREDRIALCRAASENADSGAEAARWLARLGDAERDGGDAEALARAADAYRAALARVPEDRDVESALRDVYRESGDAESLAELLSIEIARRDGPSGVAPRVERAALLAGPLAKPENALVELRGVLEIEPAHREALDRALELAEELDRHDDWQALIDARLAQPLPSDVRAELLHRRADLLSGPLDDPSDAVAAYREALALEPGRNEARRSLRQALEALERWPAALDCLYLEACAAPPDERAPILERAAQIAAERLSPDASLAWLERLRAERPRDPSVPARIADVHRHAGRPEALLRALEDELALATSDDRRRQLHLDRARVLERDLESPGRAMAALEAARIAAPTDEEVLRELDRLYEATGRSRERVQVLEARIEETPFPERAALHRRTARLYRETLREPESAVPHLLRAVDAARLEGGAPLLAPERPVLLAELADALRSSGQIEAWARAAEAELASLAAGECDERRIRLHYELACTYREELADRAAALRHGRALLPLDGAGVALDDAVRDRVELDLIDGLRADANHVELEHRLAARLSRAGDAEAETGRWLELARLRHEALHAPAAALEAYSVVLERTPASRTALRGGRQVAECLGDWREVARILELELAGPTTAGAALERAALQRKLGDVRWHRLGDRDRAARAFADALGSHDRDLVALRCLEQLAEERERWGEALDRYEQEIGTLGEDEPERRQWVWLRVAELAHTRCDDGVRAVKGYREAEAIAPIDPSVRRTWAELHDERGESDSFCDVFSAWCDDPDAGARADDHLRLARALRGLARDDEALARARRALELDETSAAAWRLIADLHEERDEPEPACAALESAAEIVGGRDAAACLQRAARLVDESDPARAGELLRRGAGHDAASATLQAQLADVEERLERWSAAERAAGSALDLASTPPGLSDDERVAVALVGGRAAREQERLEAAARFFGAALEIVPEEREALDAQADVLFRRDDVDAARALLERRLELTGAPEVRPEQLSMLGLCLERAGEPDAALERYRDALRADPELEDAHAGSVRIHEAAGRHDAAISGLETWAGQTREARQRAELWLRAAEIDAHRERPDASEAHLRRALEADAGLGPAARALAELLWTSDRVEPALAAATAGLEAVDDVASRAALALIRGRALEASDSEREAIEAYATCVQEDPRCVEAALSRARLLRSLGDWRDAADSLSEFARRHPDAQDAALAAVHHELGRLLAGPLEDVAAAIDAYSRAVSLRPELTTSREPLARLLGHFPERWREAVEQHRELLEEDPTRAGSLRSLVAIAKQHGSATSRDGGLALLRALGIASADELGDAPPALPSAFEMPVALADETDEMLRRLTCQAAQELAESELAESPSESPDGPAGDDVARYRATLAAVETELCAPALLGLDEQALAAAVLSLTSAVLAGDDGEHDGAAAALAARLGRWTRRKLRRTLEGCDPERVAAIDFGVWRRELRALAAGIALQRWDGSLRSALLALCEGAERDVPESADLTSLVAGSPTARGLLGRIVATWCNALADGD